MINILGRSLLAMHPPMAYRVMSNMEMAEIFIPIAAAVVIFCLYLFSRMK